MNTTAAVIAHPAAVIVHDLGQAMRVLAAAERTGRPVRLCSPPAAGTYLGPAVFKSMIDQARARLAKINECMGSTQHSHVVDVNRHIRVNDDVERHRAVYLCESLVCAA